MKLLKFILISIFCFNDFVLCKKQTEERSVKKENPTAIKGVLDLRDHDFNSSTAEDGVVNLNGDWEFYWEEFIDPHKAKTPENFIEVPSNWHDKSILSRGKSFLPDGNGFASYKLKVLLPEKLPHLSILIEGVDTAYELYINGAYFSGKGKIGKTREEMEPLNQAVYFAIPDFEEMEIIIYASNFHHRKAGIRDPIVIGNRNVIESIQKRHFVFDIILFSSLAIMGLYHLGLYFTRRKDKSPLHFSIFCILIAVRTISINERLVLEAFPFLNFTIAHKLEFVSFYYSAWAFMQFLHYLFPEEFPKKWYLFFGIVLVPASIVVILTPMSVYTWTLQVVQVTILIAILYSLKVIIAAIIQNRIGAKFFFLGMLLFFASIINDILKSMDIVHTPYLTSYGFISFILFQAMVLSSKFANSFLESERLSVELKAFSESLELKVIERTLSLEKVNKHVEIEKQLAILAQKETEKQKKEIEALNEISKSINTNLEINSVIEYSISHIRASFDIELCSVSLIKGEEIEVIFINEHPLIPTEFFKFFPPLRLEDTDHVSGFVYKTKKSIYTHDLQGLTNDIEIKFVEITKIKSYLCIPLLLKGDVIGMLGFGNYNRTMELTPAEILSLEKIAEQLTVAIYNSNLLKQVQEEKGIAVIAQKEAEKAKKETEYLNEFSKLINLENNLDLIFKYTVENIKQKFDVDIFSLQLVMRDKKKIFTRCIELSDKFSEETINKYKDLNYKLNFESAGTLYLTYSRKKTLYLKDINTVPDESISDFDKDIKETFHVSSALQIPLLVQNEVIGIMVINKSGGMQKLKKSDIKFIESICEQLAIAVNNSSLYETVEEQRQLAEVEKGIAIVAQFEAEKEKEKSEKLLLNILPKEIVMELKDSGSAEPRFFESVSVLFTDFKGFTTIAETMTASDLVKELDACFVQFDKITERNNLEKLKTIGDSYMCAGGIPRINKTHAIDSVLAAIEIQNFMNMMKEIKEVKGFPYWELRLGIHTGPLVAGVIGEKKFAYDVWGDTVNTASRMESSGTPTKINISGTTYEVIKNFFDCEHRGRIKAKNKGEVEMYYVNGIKKEFSLNGDMKTPNEKFWINIEKEF